MKKEFVKDMVILAIVGFGIKTIRDIVIPKKSETIYHIRTEEVSKSGIEEPEFKI